MTIIEYVKLREKELSNCIADTESKGIISPVTDAFHLGSSVELTFLRNAIERGDIKENDPS